MKKLLFICLLFCGLCSHAQSNDTILAPKGVYKITPVYTLSRTPLFYWNAYGNFVSLSDTVHSLFSVTNTGTGNATYNSSTGVFNIPSSTGGTADNQVIEADSLGATPTTNFPFSTKKGLYLINYKPSSTIGGNIQSSPAIYFRGSATPSTTSLPEWGRVYTTGAVGGTNGTVFNFESSLDSSVWTSVATISTVNGIGATRGSFSTSVSAPAITSTSGFYLDANGMNIGTGSSNPNPFAFMNMTLSTKGLLVNRMTTTARMKLGTNPYTGVVTTGGSGYTFTTGATFSMTGGSGTGTTARIFQTGGVVTSVTFTTNTGSGYKVGDVLSATLSGGSGFTYTVTGLQGDAACGLMVYDTTLNNLYTWNCSNHAWEPQGKPSHVVFTPTTGGTVTAVAYNEEIINPAGTIAALTITLPSSPNNNDRVYLKFTQAVTTITYSGGTVVGLPTSASAGQQWYATYDLTDNKWY